MLNHVAKTARIESNDGCLAQERLDCDHPKSFLRRGYDDGRGSLVKPRKVGLRELSVPAHTRGDP